MPPETPSAADVLARLADMLGLRDTESRLAGVLGSLQRQTRAQLLEWSRCLGLTGVGELATDALMRRVREALEALGIGTPPADAPRADADAEGEEPPPADRAHRFDLGQPAERGVAPEHIPWSYGQDRVTAMVVDPDRLFVYWEMTDDGIARARAALGKGGPDAWLDLRVYDVSGRLFDGTNAHSYADHKIARTDRQWFFDVGRPTSTAIVEVGLKSFEGYFVRIARSGRADFPRKEPAPPGAVEWLTVHAASGDVAPPVPAPELPAAPADVTTAWPEARAHGAVVAEGFVAGEALEDAPHWERTFHTAWQDGERTLEWQGPAVRTTWEAGPFEVPVESPTFVEERHEGVVQTYAHNGHTRVVYGPWKVVIRGLNAHAEREVVATWEVQRSWTTTDAVERDEPGGAPVAVGGASEQRPGASERRWPGASGVRFGGASEVWRLGATELRFLGASERLYGGASERVAGGASERQLRGASERRLGGASEHAYGGGSEPRLADVGPRVSPDDAPLPYPKAGKA